MVIDFIMHDEERIIYANDSKFDKYWKRKLKKSIEYSILRLERQRIKETFFLHRYRKN